MPEQINSVDYARPSDWRGSNSHRILPLLGVGVLAAVSLGGSTVLADEVDRLNHEAIRVEQLADEMREGHKDDVANLLDATAEEYSAQADQNRLFLGILGTVGVGSTVYTVMQAARRAEKE